MKHKACGEKVVILNNRIYCPKCRMEVKGERLFDKEG